MKRYIFLLAFVFCSLVLSARVFAQTPGINLSLSPTFLSLRTNPGEEISSKFTIKNNNNVSEHLVLNLVRFAQGEKGVVIRDLDKNDPFSTWITFSEKEFDLPSNSSKTITVKISPPKTAALGYYYAIMVSRKQQAAEKQTGTVISASSAIPLLLEVRSPSAKREVQLVSFTTDKLFYEYLPANFSITLKNTGNIHASPQGSIFIDALGKKDIAYLNVNEGRGNILPNSERTFDASWADAFALRTPKEQDLRLVTDDKGNIIHQTSFDFSKADKFRVGRYTAHALIIYDNGERDIPLEATATFWVVPWKIVGGGLLFALFAALGLKNVFLTNLRRIKNLLGKKD